MQADYAKGGSDPKLRGVARSTVPIVRSHLDHLSKLQGDMGA